MAILPIVTRELRVAARRKSLYRLRLAAGILTLVLGVFLLSFGDNLTAIATGSSGRALFLTVSIILFLAAIASAHQTYDCLSQERREGTIGFLFLTDLNGHDIVLGKLFASALPSFYAMMATVPLLAAAALLGGVTGAEIWRTSLALLNLFFFAQNSAILASAFSRDRASAARATAAILSLSIVGLAIIDVLARHRLWMAKALNPAYPFVVATGIGGVSGSNDQFWLSFVAVHWMAWAFLATASLAIPRVWQEKPEKPGRYAAPAIAAGRVGGNPFEWLLCRKMGRPFWIWLALGSIVVAELCALSLTRSVWSGAIAVSILPPHFLLKVWLATAAGRSIEGHRRDGSLEVLLACTALSEKEILYGQRLALRRFFLGPAIALIAVDVAIVFWANDPLPRWVAIGSVLSLPIDLVTLRWLATWFAMSQKKPGRSAPTALFWISVFPTVFIALPIISVGAFTDYGTGFCLWLLLSSFLDGIFYSLSRDKLTVCLRSMAGGEATRTYSSGLFRELTVRERALVLRN
jgi:hypothetical protein